MDVHQVVTSFANALIWPSALTSIRSSLFLVASVIVQVPIGTVTTPETVISIENFFSLRSLMFWSMFISVKLSVGISTLEKLRLSAEHRLSVISIPSSEILLPS